MKSTQKAQEALERVERSLSMTNYPTIYHEFVEKGIALHDIKPRVNVFTFTAWKAKGRKVKKGEHGVKIITFVKCEKEHTKNGKTEVKEYSRPWSTTVFHVSQTEPLRELLEV